MTTTMTKNKIDATVYNFAFGDAWGYVTEFKKFKKIVKKNYSSPDILKVSDDTQMGIYTMSVIEMLDNEGFDFSSLNESIQAQDRVRKLFAEAYVEFYYDQWNNRAPGATCMKALSEYQFSSKITGLEGSLGNDSLGCGTIMRSPWIGLLPYDRETIVNLNILQSQTTHGDPVDWVASAVNGLMVADYFRGDVKIGDFRSTFDHALSVLDEIKSMSNISGIVWDALDMNGFSSIEEDLRFFSSTWDVFKDALHSETTMSDVNKIFGEGWIATESLYNALGVVDLYEDDVLMGIKRLVYTEGDSDSIAAMGGAFFGAIYGENAISLDFMVPRFEKRYQRKLSHMVDFMNKVWS